jgi:hypothetical protein
MSCPYLVSAAESLGRRANHARQVDLTAPERPSRDVPITLRRGSPGEYLTGVGTYERYGLDIGDERTKRRGKGAIMLTDEWLSMINAEREREIELARQAHLVDRNRIDDEVAGNGSAERQQSVGRIVRPAVQPCRPTADPSL